MRNCEWEFKMRCRFFILFMVALFMVSNFAVAKGFDVSDIEAQIKAKEAAKKQKELAKKRKRERILKQRVARIKNMRKAFKKIEWINAQKISDKTKKVANRRFLKAFAKDMEWTNEDNELRRIVKGYYHTLTQDKTTGLIWQDNVAVLKKRVSWGEAKEYCQKLSIDKVSGFRVPTLQELKDATKRDIFTNRIRKGEHIKLKDFWTADEINEKTARYVYDLQGDDSWGLKSEKSYVRCAKGGEK